MSRSRNTLRSLRTGNLEDENRVALVHLVANLEAQLANGSGERRGNLHRGLVGLQREQRLLGGDRIPNGNVEFDHFDVGGAAQIGYGDGFQFHVHSRARCALLMSGPVTG